MTIEVDYRFPPGINAERQAKVIAVGQTAGTWDARFAHREEAFKRHLAEVAKLETDAEGYSLATIRFPEANVENDISSLLTAIFGKYSMAGVAKIVGVRLPETYGSYPLVGISGIRSRLGVFNRPLIMAIFKPALGLSADDHGAILEQVAYAGLDIIKDDEIVGDLEVAPTLKRLEACRHVLNEVKDKTGRVVLVVPEKPNKPSYSKGFSLKKQLKNRQKMGNPLQNPGKSSRWSRPQIPIPS